MIGSLEQLGSERVSSVARGVAWAPLEHAPRELEPLAPSRMPLDVASARLRLLEPGSLAEVRVATLEALSEHERAAVEKLLERTGDPERAYARLARACADLGLSLADVLDEARRLQPDNPALAVALACALLLGDGDGAQLGVSSAAEVPLLLHTASLVVDALAPLVGPARAIDVSARAARTLSALEIHELDGALHAMRAFSRSAAGAQPTSALELGFVAQAWPAALVQLFAAPRRDDGAARWNQARDLAKTYGVVGEAERAALTAAVVAIESACGHDAAVRSLGRAHALVGEGAGYLLLASLEEARRGEFAADRALENALERAASRLASLEPFAPPGISAQAWRELLCARLSPQALTGAAENLFRLLVQLFHRYPSARTGHGLRSVRTALRRARLGGEEDGAALEQAFVGAAHRRV